MRPLGRFQYVALLVAALLAPVAAHAEFVDEYKSNVAANTTDATNAVIRLLNRFSELWIPGPTWDTGTPTAVGASVLDHNIQFVIDVTRNRTDAEATAAYLDDRRNQSYSVIEGLGPLAPFYYAGSGAVTTIPDEIPLDATTTRYDDGGTGAGRPTSALGSVVSLVGTLRGPFSSTTPPKNFFLYPRPWRRSADVVVVPTLEPAKSPTPATDSALPSGHTNAGYLASLALAYATPERFQELLTRASELGDSRIVAGMHSPLDVMGGRMQATALAAAILSDPANATLKQAAYDQAHAYFLEQTGITSLEALDDYAHSADPSTDRFADHETNRADYTYRLTYGLSPISATDTAMMVPTGTEVLLETRLPYLEAEQRREVLRTTGLASGYPLLDDAEGWGRLNLFAAADGYGAFDRDVTVTMDASQGGFNARDVWRNDISGVGKLIKQGTGSLTLTGQNTYTGSTQIDGGTLAAGSPTALGTGDVVLNAGTLVVDTTRVGGRARGEKPGTLTVGGYTQRTGGTLVLTIAGGKRAAHRELLEVDGIARFAGTLRLVFSSGFEPATDDFEPAGDHAFKIISFRRHKGVFSEIVLDGLPAGYRPRFRYTRQGLAVKIVKAHHDRDWDGQDRDWHDGDGEGRAVEEEEERLLH